MGRNISAIHALKRVNSLPEHEYFSIPRAIRLRLIREAIAEVGSTEERGILLPKPK